MAAISRNLDSVAWKQNNLERHKQHFDPRENYLMSLNSKLEGFIKFYPTLLYARIEF
jgi:hypothetical protein